MTMEVRTSIRLPREIRVAAERAASDMGISLNHYIRLVLSHQLGVPLPPHGNTRER